MKRLLLVALTLVFAAAGCERRSSVAHRRPHAHRTAAAPRPLRGKAPVFRVKHEPKRYVVYDPNDSLWYWLLQGDRGYVVTATSRTPPPCEAVPVGVTSPAALPPPAGPGAPAAQGPAPAAPATVEVETVSAQEIATWEGEGGNLGPQGDESGGMSDGEGAESGESGGGDSGGGDSGGGDSGGGDSGGGDAGGGE